MRGRLSDGCVCVCVCICVCMLALSSIPCSAPYNIHITTILTNTMLIMIYNELQANSGGQPHLRVLAEALYDGVLVNVTENVEVGDMSVWAVAELCACLERSVHTSNGSNDEKLRSACLQVSYSCVLMC